MPRPANAEVHDIGQGAQACQLTGSYHDEANTLYADGKQRVDRRDGEAHSRIARNTRQRDMTMGLLAPAS